jgi:hypothetical protein
LNGRLNAWQLLAPHSRQPIDRQITLVKSGRPILQRSVTGYCGFPA